MSVPLPMTAQMPRLLAGVQRGRAPTFSEHVQRYGPLPDRRDLVDLVAAAGLVGHGGAAFPTAAKLRSMVVGNRGSAIAVANGVEGEPASGKDKLLVSLAPQLVLDGLVAAARAVGAREAVVAIAAGSRGEQAALEQAISERRGERVAIRVAAIPPGFVSGEETAVLQGIRGGLPKPTLKPPFPTERGLGGAPTLVQNVETLAHIALISRFGVDWFRSAGATTNPGTALVTLGGSVGRPGVHEIELGSTLAELIARGGGVTERVSAFLVGGYFGRWVSAVEQESTALTSRALGAGAVIALSAQACPLLECARVVRYLADESAGQCGPCLHGLAAIAAGFEAIAMSDARSCRSARAQLARWTSQVIGRGGCRHPDGVAVFVDSALTVFASEVERHAQGKRCIRIERGQLPVGRGRR